MPVSLVPPVQNIIQGNLITLLPETLNHPMGHLRFCKWISYSFPHLIDIHVLFIVCGFSHWMEVFHFRQATPPFVAKILLEDLQLGNPSQIIYFTAQLFGWFYNIFIMHIVFSPHGQSNTLTTPLRLNWQNLQRPSKYLVKGIAIGSSTDQI